MSEPKIQRKRVSGDEHLASRPLLYGLEGTQFAHQLSLQYNPPDRSAENLRQGASDLALIPAIEYARKKETWLIVPDLCIAAAGTCKKIQLFFNSGLKDIHHIIVPNLDSTESILLQIILQERYEMKPEYSEASGDLNSLLARADAVLLTDDLSLENCRDYRNRLDVNEEWVSLTGLPFVYAVWAGREFIIEKEDIVAVKMSYEIGHRNIETISKTFAESHKEEWGYYHDFLTKDLHYQLSEQEKDSLTEFYSYAFFFGLSEYIPELHFFSF